MKRLRILWISHFVPYPPKGGCFQRSYNLIRRVGRVHELHLVALKHKAATHPEEETLNAREALLQDCASVRIVDISHVRRPAQLAWRALRSLAAAEPLSMTIFRSEEMREQLRSVIRDGRFDAVHFDTIGLADYLPEVGDMPTLMTHHGAESSMIRRRIRREPNPLKKAFFVAEWLMLRNYEQKMCPRFDVNITMSDLDKEILRSIAPQARFETVANGVDVDYFSITSKSAERVLVFAGRLDQYSNRDGILYFMREVWPGLLRMYPDIVFHVIGSNPPRELSDIAAKDRRVQLHGFVPDVRPFFQQATAAVCPIRDGGGTRIKVLDALAQGMPIVSTTVCAEGIDVVPERDLLIADSPAEFQAQIGRIFTDANLRRRLAVNARQLAETRYSWEALAHKLMSEYADIADHHNRSANPADAQPPAGRSSASRGKAAGLASG